MYIITIALIAGSSAYIKTNHTASMAINGIEAIAVVFLILEEIKINHFNAYSYAMIAFMYHWEFQHTLVLVNIKAILFILFRR